MKTGVFLLLSLVLAAIECPAQSTVVPYDFSTIAGQLVDSDGFGGYANGTNGGAQFEYPFGIAVDLLGNLYVADSYNDVIRKMTHVGTNWVVTTLAGQPGVAGFGPSSTQSAVLFNEPRGVAVDGAGNVYVADTGNNLIREISTNGSVTTIGGGTTNAGYQDGNGLIAQFDYPLGIAVDNSLTITSGTVYVADTYNNAIRKLTQTGNSGIWDVETLGGTTTLNYPGGVAVDGAGSIYVADTDNNVIRKMTPEGVVSTLAGSPPTTDQIFDYYDSDIPYPSQDGTGTNAGFYFPYGVAVDSASNVYVADTYDSEIRKVTPQQVVTTLGGEPAFEPDDTVFPLGGHADGAGSAASFNVPSGIAVDGDGNVFVGDTFNCLIREGVAPVVQVVALEVTQVIQDWNNSVPLIEGKQTNVRAHLQLPSVTNLPVIVSGALLYGSGPNGPYPDSPLNPINSGGSLDVQTANASNILRRESFAGTLNFRLPEDWLSGSNTLQLVWPGGLQPINVVPGNCAVHVNFVPAAIPQIEFIPIIWIDSNGVTYVVPTNLLATLPDRVISCFPVSNVAATFGPPLPILNTSGTQPTDSDVEAWLNIVRNIENQPAQKIYHGILPVDPNSTQRWTGDTAHIPGPISYSMMFGTNTLGIGRQTVSHELGHNLGLYHDVSAALFGTTNGGSLALGAATPPEVGPTNVVYPLFQPFGGFPNGAPTLGPMTNGDNSLIFGFDSVTQNVLSPTNVDAEDIDYYFDLMSYCRPNGPADEDCWPSSVTYAALLQSINTNFGAATPDLQRDAATLANNVKSPKSPRPKGGNDDYLMVAGSVNFSAATAQFLPCLPLTYTNTPPTEPPGTNFLLEALDDSGDVLQTAQFDLQPNYFAEDYTSQIVNFTVFLTANPSIQKIVLSYNGSLLATLTASPNPPTLSLTAPNGGEDFTSGTVNIAWSGSDLDGNSLAYTIEYSADDGATWHPLALNLPAQNLAIDSSQLAATTQGLIRVIASDGLDTAIAQSAATFTVQPHAPVVSINAPIRGSIFIADQQLFLDASAYDMQDGPLSGTNVQWSSDRDGALGAAAIVNFDARNLSEGNHTITVTATDSAGLTGSAVTQILVLHYQPPQLSFQVTPGVAGSYPPYGTLSWPSYYTNYVLQSSSSLISGWANIANNPPEVIGNQQSVYVSVTNKTSFFRLVSQP